MTPSTQRPIPLQIRPDLVIKRIDYLGVGYWVVKDPAGLKYYRLQQEQYEVLRLLDGVRSLEDVRDEMIRIMPTVRLQLSDIQHLITDLHEKGLVYSNREGQGAALLKKHWEEKKKRFFNTLRSLLYLRLPGWDPDRTLNVIYPFFRWLYTPFGVFVWGAVTIASWLLLGIQFENFSEQLPHFQSFFGWPNLIYLWFTLACCKIIHEFGHGLTCKHFGGECHEMGVMLLVFSPCLYCDVSDSWMLRNKWARIMIGAAGMYIEVFLSAIAIFVWWYSEQGLLHNLALNTFFVTTITTVIFNANPLMRFDGYYMMSDFLEIPNLRPKADKLLREAFAWYCLGIESRPDPFMPETGRIWFITFAVASGIYRWFVVAAITVFLYTVLKPYGLQSIGATMAVFSLGTIAGSMVYNVYRIITAPRLEPMSKPKIALTLMVLGGLIGGGMLIRVPLYIEATFIVEPLDVRHVYTKTPGILVEERVQPGQHVEAGAVLASLQNPEKEDEKRDLELKKKLQEYEYLTQRNLGNDGQMQLAREREAAFEDQLREVESQLRELTIVAPVSGSVVAPPRTPEPDYEQARKQLPAWRGIPSDSKNAGALLEERTHLLSIAPNDRFQAIVLIDQGDINDLVADDFAERLQETQAENRRIELKFDHLAARTYEAPIKEVSPGALEYVPEQLSNKLGGELPTVTDKQGREKLISKVYQATVELTEDTASLKSGMRGRARFWVEERTLGQWLWRYLCRTFHFRL